MRGKRAISDEVFDAIGTGFGPSNLALASCAQEHGVHRAWRFFEKNPQVQWHPGMLFEGARMQISFLKDLVSPRNPELVQLPFVRQGAGPAGTRYQSQSIPPDAPRISRRFFFHYSEAKRAALLQELRGTNYGVIREDLLDAVRTLKVEGRRR